MINKLVESFAQGFSKSVVTDVAKQVEHTVDRQVSRMKRKFILLVAKSVFLVLALVTLVAGFVLLGAKYIGMEWMLIASGAVLLLGFLLS